MHKINIGAGSNWYEEGWELLDNGSGRYNEPWKHRGKSWDTRLPDDTYDIVFTSHMLEHVPHFRIEKTIAEFNRIMKTG
jgi:predicted SAM-dependent methyltransferase